MLDLKPSNKKCPALLKYRRLSQDTRQVKMILAQLGKVVMKLQQDAEYNSKPAYTDALKA